MARNVLAKAVRARPRGAVTKVYAWQHCREVWSARHQRCILDLRRQRGHHGLCSRLAQESAQSHALTVPSAWRWEVVQMLPNLS